jgi:transposase
MRYQGISTPVIAKSIGKCSVIIISYIRDWNSKGVASIKYNRGGNIPSKLTDDIINDIKYIVANKCPKDFGYEHSKWTLSLVSTYIADNYGPKYSKAWMSKLMKNLGFSYKRGTFQTILADKVLQKEFLKNDTNNGYS